MRNVCILFVRARNEIHLLIPADWQTGPDDLLCSEIGSIISSQITRRAYIGKFNVVHAIIIKQTKLKIHLLGRNELSN